MQGGVGTGTQERSHGGVRAVQVISDQMVTKWWDFR